MQDTRRLYEAFGELIYVTAMADGKIQKEELTIIEEKLSQHPWGQDIKWSFDYEVNKARPIEELYKKVITCCEMHGPDKEYDALIQLLKEVAHSSEGIDQNEKKIIESFSDDLTERFKINLTK